MTGNCPRCGNLTEIGIAFCGHCGQAQVGRLPPTMGPFGAYPTQSAPGFAPTAAMQSVPPGAWAPPSGPAPYGSPFPPPPPPPVRTSAGALVAVFAAGVVLTGVGAAIVVGRPSPANPPTAVRTIPIRAPATAANPPRVIAPPPPGISFPLAIVHYRTPTVEVPTAAVGPPDGRYAVIRAGMLTLEMRNPEQLISDGAPTPDLRVEVDPAIPGPFRVEIGVGHNVFVRVAEGISGSAMIDIDAAGVRVGRFVRISTLSSRSAVGLDAVLVRIP